MPVPENRYALIVASYQYEDPQLKRLSSPKEDANALARVLQDEHIGCFQVKTLLNKPSQEVSEAIEEFFEERKRDDLLLFYFSGHGIKSEDGKLYFAQVNTTLKKKLRSTAISSDFLNELMKNSRSRRQIMILDCCFSGAFAKGLVAKADASVGLRDRFEGGSGRIILTSSDSLEYSFEGSTSKPQSAAGLSRSVFTNLLVTGLETGKADSNQDGLVSPDDLYDYVSDQMRKLQAMQTPKIWKLDAEGDIYIARYPTRPPGIPAWITEAITSTEVSARLAAVAELSRLIKDEHMTLASASRRMLESIAQNDPSPVVRGAASGALSARIPEKSGGSSRKVDTILQPQEIKPGKTPEGSTGSKPKISTTGTRTEKIAATSGQPSSQKKTQINREREQIKKFVRAFQQDDVVICAYCSMPLKARNYIRHYDEHHPGSPPVSISKQTSAGKPKMQQAAGPALVSTEREILKAFVRSINPEDLIVCAYCSMPVKAKHFIHHYDEFHSSSPAPKPQ
ncbi:MAG: caspase family protein [Anaerolineaceae bacterium]